MKHFSALLLSLLSVSAANAQSYCSPVFLNGCFSWQNQSISIGALDWLSDGDCTAYDYTALSTTVNAGDQVPMNVVNGIWCGCAVWVDFDNSYTFEESENLHYEYAGGDPSYTYDFSIAIPAGTPTGSYRLRVIAAWGSDGFLNTNTNGYGPCGDFQYGNFDDFTLNVIGSTGIAQAGSASVAPISVGPNPTDGLVTLTTQSDVERIKVLTTDGRAVQDYTLTTRTEKVQVDLSPLPNGVYLLQCISGNGSRTLQVMKQ